MPFVPQATSTAMDLSPQCSTCTRKVRPCTTASWSSLQRGSGKIEAELNIVRSLADEEMRVVMMHLDRLQLLTIRSERLEKQLRLCVKGCRERLAHDEATASNSPLKVDSSKPEVDPEANISILSDI